MKVDKKIDYEQLARRATRFMVKEAMSFFALNNPSGGAHLIITFRTSFPGVMVPLHLRENYPLEMTVVLQHRYDQLVVSSDKFSVVLTFKGANETIVIPFSAISVYEDVNSNFSLTLKPEEIEDSSDVSGGGEGLKNGDRIISIDQLRKKK